jgi:hypothetical protein
LRPTARYVCILLHITHILPNEKKDLRPTARYVCILLHITHILPDEKKDLRPEKTAEPVTPGTDEFGFTFDALVIAESI